MLTDDSAGITDMALVKRCQKQDQTAFRQLYQRYRGRVRSTLYSLCGTQVLDDLVQEVFLRVWQGLPKLRQPKTFSTWLYRITWNVASDQRRRFAQRRDYLYGGVQRDRVQSGKSPELVSPDAPDLIKLHYQGLVQQGLQSLSLEQRAVIVLCDLEDLPQKEVAHILKIPVGTVKSRLHNARNTLRDYLQQQGVTL